MKYTYLALLLFLFSCQSEPLETVNWPGYLGDPASSQASVLNEINKSNVSQLEVAWTYSMGDNTEANKTQIQCNPIIIDGTLYGSSAYLKIFALDATTGQEKWHFDPFAETGFQHPGMGVNRGLAYWTDGKEERILFTAASTLYCLDAKTGTLNTDFGEGGQVNLLKGLERNIDDLFLVSNTPGIIFGDLLILGSRVSESVGAAPGHVRAFNVKTGEQTWIFHTIPFPGEAGYETWPKAAWQYAGGANAWSGFSLDIKNEIVFVPTGSAATDFYGGDRLGDNLYANCLLALDANTGKRIWHYQFVHHDLWDRDLPAPPNLITLEKDGQAVEAVAQITKSAHIFVFDRKTGEPLFPIEEVPVPASTLDGEHAAPTQPIPSLPKPFSRNRMLEEDITQRTPEAYAYVKSRWDTLLEGPHFVPPSTQGSIILPGLDGGGEWGGAAFDASTNNLIINASEIPWILQMIKHENNPQNLLAKGKKIYNTYCASCHGGDLKGGEMFGNVPDLNGLQQRMDQATLSTTLANGKGAMPSFKFLSEPQIEALSTFLLDLPDGEAIADIKADRNALPYYLNGYKRFKDQDGYPAITPPWGTLNAVNLQTGEQSWKVTLGDHPELNSPEPTGSESYGGPVVTAGGLVFMAGTPDQKIRAFDKDNGDLLWEANLPAAGFATPATYAVDGKQYVVIACGGGKLGKDSGDVYVAFALE
ncbi:MAG: hypothetical protein Sapg2KO_26780 [Saprospiraceae bacterium]